MCVHLKPIPCTRTGCVKPSLNCNVPVSSFVIMFLCCYKLQIYILLFISTLLFGEYILYWISCLGLTPHKPVIATDDQVDWILMSHLFQCQSKIKSRERLPRILSNLHLIHCIHQDFTNPIRKSPRSQRLCLICSSFLYLSLTRFTHLLCVLWTVGCKTENRNS